MNHCAADECGEEYEPPRIPWICSIEAIDESVWAQVNMKPLAYLEYKSVDEYGRSLPLAGPRLRLPLWSVKQ